MANAGRLVYPLALHQHLLQRQLRRTTPGTQAGRLLFDAILALSRAEGIARSLTPFDPSGL